MKKIFLAFALLASSFLTVNAQQFYFEEETYEVLNGSSVVIPVCFSTPLSTITGCQANISFSSDGLSIDDVTGVSAASNRYVGSISCALTGSTLGFAAGSANPIIGSDGALINVTVDTDDTKLTVGQTYTFTLSNCLYFIYPDTYNQANSTVSVNIKVVDHLTIDENKKFTPSAESGVNVELVRAFEANKFYTVCLPFALTRNVRKAAWGSDMAAYSFAGMTSQWDATDTYIESILLSFNTLGTNAGMVANTPYIIKTGASSSIASSYTFSGVAVAAGEPITSAADDVYGKTVSFVGTYTPNTVVAERNLYLKDGNLYSSVGTTKVKGTRAYFDLSAFYASYDAEFGSPVKVLVDIDGIETSIDALDAEEVVREGWYDLNGRKLGSKPAAKGIYINNGKKVVIK